MLKLNNRNRKNSIKLTFCRKKFLKKNFFEKKFLPAYLCRCLLRCAEFLLNKWVSTYLGFGDFKVPKNCSSQNY